MTPAIIFLAAAAFIVYTLFGYPLLLAMLAKRGARPVKAQWEPKSVSVLLAVRNGEPWVRQKLRSILDLDYPRELLEILVASDGSTDQTEEYVRRFESQGVCLFALPPGGKAGALNVLIKHARGEILFFTDVRQKLDPACLRNLVACFADESVGVASGELVILDERGREDSHTGLYWTYEKWIRKRLSAIDSLPGATGSIYAMRRELAAPLPADCLLDDVYLPMFAFFRGRRLILEETAKAFDSAISLKTEFRRKVRTQAGVYQILLAFPQLLGARNRMWIHFVSHKFARLLLPFALLVLAIDAFWLPSPWMQAAVIAQALFYGMALFISPVRTFVTLMAATFCAASFLFLPARLFWSAPTGTKS
ncbi:MAG: glycosyltransferase family 2 protein [Bryobacteraceae bacterium]